MVIVGDMKHVKRNPSLIYNTNQSVKVAEFTSQI